MSQTKKRQLYIYKVLLFFVIKTEEDGQVSMVVNVYNMYVHLCNCVMCVSVYVLRFYLNVYIPFIQIGVSSLVDVI